MQGKLAVKEIIFSALVLSLALGLGSAPAALAQAADTASPAPAALLERSYDFNIRPQKVPAALIELSRKADIQVLMPGGALDGYSTQGVQGTMTVQAALELLLAGTPYSYRQTDGATVTVDAPQALASLPAYSINAAVTPADSPAAAEVTIPVVAITTQSETLASPDTAEARPGTQRLDDIVVTATKREASARDLAGTVSALSGEVLADRGVQDIEDIVTSVPGLNLVDEKSAGQPNSVKRITIRGIAAGQNQVDTVGVFLDETPFSDPFLPLSSADVNPFDIAQVEVLKGPVGTLFGGSALNGAIRYLPQAPMLDEWQGKAFAEWRTFEHGGSAPIYGAMLNAPLGRDDLALRIVAIDRETAGYVDSVNRVYKAKDVNGTEQQSLRATLRWMPLSQLDLSLMYSHQDTLSKDFSSSTAGLGTYESSGSPQPSPSDVSYDLWQFKGSWAFEWADLVVIASQTKKLLDADYDQSTVAFTNPPASILFTTTQAEGQPRSQEVRLVSAAGGDWDWLVGLFNYHYELGSYSSVTALDGTLPPLLGSLPLPVPLFTEHGLIVGNAQYGGTVEERSAFGEASWRFAPDWQVTAGLRLYEFTYDVGVIFDGLICAVTDPSCALTLLHSELALASTERGVSPKLSLKWDITDDVMTYATAARGFRFGGVNAISHPEIPRTFGSDSLWSYEVGTRTQWLDRTLIADLTAFYIDWTNAQFQTNTSDGLAGYTNNVGAVEGRGVEGQLIWLTPLSGIKLTAIASYADIVTAVDFTGTAAGAETVPAGTPWPRAPKWQTTTMLDWTHLLGPVELGVGVNHTYLGKALQNFGFAGDVVIFGYSTVGLQLTAKPIADGWWWPDVAVNVNNLTGVQGLNYRYDGTTIEAAQFAQLRTYTTPRNISVRFTLEF